MLTAIVLARNEAAGLPRCLASLNFCDRLLVIDNASVDATAKIAAGFAAKVISHPLHDDFSAQRNFALAQVASGWVLFVDADEVVPPDLAAEIASAIHSPRFTGFILTRVDLLWGRRLTHGDTLAHLVRLARVGSGAWTGRVHETWRISGVIGRLSAPLLHYPHPTVAEFLAHLNYYSTLRAAELHTNHIRSHILSIIVYPLGKFITLYLIKLGFLDGIPGLISALMLAFYSFLVRGKLYLLGKGIPTAHV